MRQVACGNLGFVRGVVMGSFGYNVAKL